MNVVWNVMLDFRLVLGGGVVEMVFVYVSIFIEYICGMDINILFIFYIYIMLC